MILIFSVTSIYMYMFCRSHEFHNKHMLFYSVCKVMSTKRRMGEMKPSIKAEIYKQCNMCIISTCNVNIHEVNTIQVQCMYTCTIYINQATIYMYITVIA